MKPRVLLRQCLPFGFVEARRERIRLSRLGLPPSPSLLPAVETCRYELWPHSLRQRRQPWTLVDVGANVGDFTKAAARLAPIESAYLFEPQPLCRQALDQVIATIPNAKLIAAAAGREEGSLPLNLTENSRMASAFPPADEIAVAYGENDFVIAETISVPMVTLDSSIPTDLVVGLLKLDVQGYELEVLAGAESTLRRTQAVLVEVNYVAHYEAGATFGEVYDRLRELGFHLSGVSAPYCGPDGAPLWADAVFIPSEP